MRRFRDALLEKLEGDGAPTMKAVAEGSGVPYSRIKIIKHRENSSTNVDDAVKIAHFFNQSLDDFLEGDGLEDRIELIQLYGQLSDDERSFLLKSAKALADGKNDKEEN